MSSNRIAGFTLVEILIALFIFAIVSLVATQILSSILITKKEVAARSLQLSKIQTMSILLKRDLNQSINRPIREPNGNTIPAFKGDSSNMSFTRTGNMNPLNHLKQSHLLRIAYKLKGNQLIRIQWPRLDRVDSNQPLTRILASGIITGKFVYLGEDNQSYSNWPTGFKLLKKDTSHTDKNAQPSLQDPKTPLPKAVIIILTLKNWGNYKLIVPIAEQ